MIQATGGVRKLRIPTSGRGKSGGSRVIYFFGGNRIPVYAFLLYTKSDREDMNPAERKAVVREVTALARDLRKNKRYKDD